MEIELYQMKKIKFLFLIGIFITLGIIFLAKILKPGLLPFHPFCFLDIGSHRVPNDAIEIHRENHYGQTFTPNFDGLFMISIFIPKQQILDPNEELHFYLNDIHLKWKFSEIVPPKHFFYPLPPDSEVTEKGFHFSFQFPVIKETKEKELFFYFESTAPKGKGIKMGLWKDRPYYEALTQATHEDGFLAFRTFHTLEGSFKENFLLAIHRIKVKLKKDLTFTIVYSILLIIVGSLYIKTYVKR